jgi:hypothetical protein
VHRGHAWGEQNDPGELHNPWDDPAAQDNKRDVLLRFVHAEMAKALVPMPRLHAM